MQHSPSHSIDSIRVGLCVWQQSHAIPQESHVLTKLFEGVCAEASALGHSFNRPITFSSIAIKGRVLYHRPSIPKIKGMIFGFKLSSPLDGPDALKEGQGLLFLPFL